MSQDACESNLMTINNYIYEIASFGIMAVILILGIVLCILSMASTKLWLVDIVLNKTINLTKTDKALISQIRAKFKKEHVLIAVSALGVLIVAQVLKATYPETVSIILNSAWAYILVPSVMILTFLRLRFLESQIYKELQIQDLPELYLKKQSSKNKLDLLSMDLMIAALALLFLVAAINHFIF